jgi:HSP20 family molecular chaperone IbpA
MSLFDSFDNELNKLFRLSFSNFNRPVKDMQPYKYIRTDNGFIFVINTLGISKTDVQVSVANDKGDPYPTLRVKGKTMMEKVQFENTVDLALRLVIDEEVEEVAYEVKDGLTIIYLKLKKPEPTSKIEAKYIDENFDF